MTDCVTVSYSESRACPLRVNAPVAGSKLPVIPNCGVKDNSSSPAAKLPLMVMVAVSICVSSTSVTDRLVVTIIGVLFSVNDAGVVSTLASTGASLTAVNSMFRDSRLLSVSPSLTTKSIVRVAADGLSLVF